MTQQEMYHLISIMSPAEKAAQLTQLNPICFGHDKITTLTGPDFGLRAASEAAPSIGSVLNCDNASDMMAIQKKHLDEDPHKIPLLFMADIIHGFRTIFPIPLAMSCSFSPELMEESCKIAALESAVSGIHVTFSPMADLVRDPRWGRVMESCGEDPCLTGRFAAAAVNGYQGGCLKEPYRIASCVKHFAAYGAPEGGREYNTVDLSYGILRDTYLPGYLAAIKQGAKLVMSSFNTVDRVPATASAMLLREILRGEWHFDGTVISDFNSVGELIHHGAADSSREAAVKSLLAGVDIEMMSTHYGDYFAGTADLSDGEYTAMSKALDDAVLRVLTLKEELGLFDDPYKDCSQEGERRYHLCPEHRASARRIAAECAVLLKNAHALPLCRGKKLGLTGPFAATTRVLGGWSAGSLEGVSLYEGIQSKIPADQLCLVPWGEPVSHLADYPDIPLPDSSLLHSLADCDTVLAAVGEDQLDTGEGASKAFLRLSPNQELLLRMLKESGKTVVAVIFSGRPLELAPILPYCDAVLQAWFLGTESGHALADLLYGDKNPSGRLSISFPYTVGQIPVYYNHFQTGRPELSPSQKARYVSRYLDCPTKPLYCFGYGLSYSEFTYLDLQINTEGGLKVSATVKNCSEVAGQETVQFYIQDPAAGLVRPVQELKDFLRIYLTPGEAQRVTFAVDKSMLSYFKTDSYVFEGGDFVFMIGPNCEDTMSQTVCLEDDYFEKECL